MFLGCNIFAIWHSVPKAKTCAILALLSSCIFCPPSSPLYIIFPKCLRTKETPPLSKSPSTKTQQQHHPRTTATSAPTNSVVLRNPPIFDFASIVVATHHCPAVVVVSSPQSSPCCSFFSSCTFLPPRRLFPRPNFPTSSTRPTVLNCMPTWRHRKTLCPGPPVFWCSMPGMV